MEKWWLLGIKVSDMDKYYCIECGEFEVDEEDSMCNWCHDASYNKEYEDEDEDEEDE